MKFKKPILMTSLLVLTYFICENYNLVPIIHLNNSAMLLRLRSSAELGIYFVLIVFWILSGGEYIFTKIISRLDEKKQKRTGIALLGIFIIILVVSMQRINPSEPIPLIEPDQSSLPINKITFTGISFSKDNDWTNWKFTTELEGDTGIYGIALTFIYGLPSFLPRYNISMGGVMAFKNITYQIIMLSSRAQVIFTGTNSVELPCDLCQEIQVKLQYSFESQFYTQTLTTLLNLTVEASL